jgi:hypothetical protein
MIACNFAIARSEQSRARFASDLLFSRGWANLRLPNDLYVWNFQSTTLSDRPNIEDEVLDRALVAREPHPNLHG